MENKDNDLQINLTNLKNNIAYITDLFTKFNKTNLKLQGEQLNVIETRNIIVAFLAILFLYKQNLGGGGKCSQFPNLSKL